MQDSSLTSPAWTRTAEIAILGPRADRTALTAILWLTLSACCVFGLLTPYIVGVIGIALFVTLAAKRQLVAAYRDLAARLFLIAFVVLGICYIISAQSPTDPLSVFNFTALILFGPFLALTTRFAAPGNMLVVVRLAAIGAAAGLAVAIVNRFALGDARAQNLLMPAILLANTSVLLGFLSTIGIIIAPRRRWLYAVPPLLGVMCAAITASRGPILVIAPLVIFCAVVIARRLNVRAVVAVPATIAYLALCALIILLFNDRVATLLGIANEIVAGMDVGDFDAGARLALYEAGWWAFLEAPIVGHGWARLMTSVVPYLPADLRQLAEWLPHLHNDVVDMAVAAGVVGVAVYVLLIATPLVAAWKSPRDSLYSLRLFACAILCMAYVFDGLTDLMFGMEFHSMLYIALTAIILGYCRDPVPSAS